MSRNEITAKVHELRELQRMADELSAEIEAIKDILKAHMTEQDTETLCGMDYKITYKPVTTNRLDTRALKAALPEIAARFTKQTTARRLTVA